MDSVKPMKLIVKKLRTATVETIKKIQRFVDVYEAGNPKISIADIRSGKFKGWPPD